MTPADYKQLTLRQRNAFIHAFMERANANYQANGFQVIGLRKVVRTMERLGVRVKT